MSVRFLKRQVQVLVLRAPYTRLLCAADVGVVQRPDAPQIPESCTLGKNGRLNNGKLFFYKAHIFKRRH